MDYGTALDKLEDFYNDKYYDEIADTMKEGRTSLILDFSMLDKYDFELIEFLNTNPEAFLSAAEEALERIDILTGGKDLNVRLNNLRSEDFVRLKDLRSKHVDNFVPVEGMIKRATDVKPEVVSAEFECTNCGDHVEKEQDSTKIKSPYKCQNCGSRKYEVVDKNMIDTQVVTVEENPDSRDGGAQPETLSVRLEGDLVDPEFQKNVVPGNIVHIAGVIRAEPVKKDSKKYDMYMEANNLEPTEQEFEQITLDDEAVDEIEGLASEDDIFDKISSSIAPKIHGHDRVKEAIALQLFGGVRKTGDDGVDSRGDIHVLLIGEPGTGKSQMMKFAGELAPKGRYVVGKSSTSAGLTASVVKEDSTGEFSLEAGAVVLAHKGLASIDEIDKMGSDDRSSLHEAMEQQQISVSKANIQATLKAETTILAAGNPKFGRFDPYEPVPEQIELGDTLMSRFDLIFPVRDEPDEDKDEELADQVLNNHLSPDESSAEISQDLLRRYIAYGRRIEPDLTKEVVEKLKEFYVDMRTNGGGEENNNVPITARQLEALIRLSEASARSGLRETVQMQDAKRAIDILTYCMKQVGVDPETGEFDADMMETGVSSSERNRLQSVRRLIKQMSDGDAVEVEAVLDKAEENGFGREKAEDIIDRLQNKGELYEPQNGKIQSI
jgi:replicative DNA helicase Mcm